MREREVRVVSEGTHLVYIVHAMLQAYRESTSSCRDRHVHGVYICTFLTFKGLSTRPGSVQFQP